MVVGQDIAEQGIESGIVNIRRQYALSKVIQHHDAGTPTQPAEGFLVKLRPNVRAGEEGQQRTALRLHPSGGRCVNGTSGVAAGA